MYLLIGIGNPEKTYLKSRHNVGRMLAKNFFGKIQNIKTLESNLAMNTSGKFVKDKIDKNNIDKLIVAFDDLDIPYGQYKLQFARGPKNHNGLNDIYEELGTNNFWHLRIGVEARSDRSLIEGKSYVLSDFSDLELKELNNVFNNIKEDLCKRLEI